MGAKISGTRKAGAPAKTRQRQLKECLTRKGIGISERGDQARDREERRRRIKAPGVQRRKKSCPSWMQYPSSIIGRAVEKRYGSKYYGCHGGVITEFDTDGASGDTIWRVSYDDGDRADYSGA